MRGWYQSQRRLKFKEQERGKHAVRQGRDGTFLRQLLAISETWRRFLASLLNPTSAALVRTIIVGPSPKPIALSLGDPPIVDETKQVLTYIAKGKAMGTEELLVELLKPELYESPR